MKKMSKNSMPMKAMPKTSRASMKTGMAGKGKSPDGFEPKETAKGLVKPMPQAGAKPETRKMLAKKGGERGSMTKKSVSKIRK